MEMELTKRIASVKKDFNLNSTRSCVFYHSQWESCKGGEHASVPYLIYRCLFAIILVTSVTFSAVCQSHLFEIFLTNWSFTLQNMYAVLYCFNIVWRKRDFLAQQYRSSTSSAARNSELKVAFHDNMTDVTTLEDRDNKDMDIDTDTVAANKKISRSPANMTTDRDKMNTDIATASVITIKEPDSSVTVISNNNNNKNYDDNAPTVIEKVIWILMNVTHVLPHIVAFGYWIFVYKHDPDQKSCKRFKSHYIVHSAAAVLALIDALVVAVPVRMTHFVFPSFVLLVYATFSYIYEVSGGQYREGKEFIYSILNWRHKSARTLMLVLTGMILSPLVHIITCWGVHHIRLKLVSFSKRYRK